MAAHAPGRFSLGSRPVIALVDRVQRILTTPAAEWRTIALEPTPPGALFSNYIVPLALIPPVCSLLSYGLFLHRGLIFGLVIGAVSFILELVYVFVVALIAEALAPSFNGVKDRTAALKWIGYSLTPRWVAGIALLIPFAGALISLVGSIYALYLLYLGAVPVMRVPQEKAVNYTVVLVIAVILLGILLASAVAAVVAAMVFAVVGGVHAVTN